MTYHFTKKHTRQNGFTLIETMVAIFILTLTIGALMTLTAQGFFSVRYARNQIVANQLLQEELEYVRNTRDTAAQQPAASWSAWLSIYVQCSAAKSAQRGCKVDPYSTKTVEVATSKTLSSQTQLNFYQDGATYADSKMSFYGYTNKFSLSNTFPTSYRRRIFVEPVAAQPDQVVVTGEITWQNGNAWKTLKQSILLTNWDMLP